MSFYPWGRRSDAPKRSAAMAYHTTQMMVKRKKARRARLLRQAIRLFGRWGYHATTVPMIVAAAGTSIGNFYFYFRNKEDVFAAALETVGEKLASALNAGMATAGPELIPQMKAAVYSLVRFLAEHPQEARILIVESSGLSKRLEAVRRGVIGSHTRGVQQALDALVRRLPPLDTAVAANCWVGAAYEAVFRWLEQPPGKRLSADRLARAIARFNLQGIGAGAEVLEE